MIKAKRFWDKVRIEEADGFRIYLDARELKTPGGEALLLPTRALAEAMAREWESVEGEIRPSDMPMTKMANSAAERVGAARADIENHLLEYLENDLIAYRAEAPEALIERQKAWDDWVKWVKKHGVELAVTQGIIAVAQPAANAESARQWLTALNDYELVSFYEYVVITGSFVLAMAILDGEIDAARGLALSRIDEEFQADQWGHIDEVEKDFERKLRDMSRAEEFQKLSRAP